MPLMNPVSAAWNTVGRFDDYESAQRAVDRLSDDGFPVDKLDIVGSGLRLVERVTGRLTSARAAGTGALSGLWAGLLLGILLGLFTSGHSFLAVALTGAAFGVLWGAVFGYVAHARTKGQRDFSSVRPDRPRGLGRPRSHDAQRGGPTTAHRHGAARTLTIWRRQPSGGQR
jgi:hypothetical protein